MYRKNMIIYGDIKSNNTMYKFILNDFKLEIVEIKKYKDDAIDLYPKTIISVDGFIEGITQNNEHIYIAIGNKELLINKFITVNIDFYIVLRQRCGINSVINTICFSGGTLNQIARLNIIEKAEKKEGELHVLYKEKNEKVISVKNSLINGRITFRGNASCKFDVEDGYLISEDDSKMYIETKFELKNIIWIFRYITNIFKFFTYRNNVGNFDIVLKNKAEDGKYYDIGECYYSNNEFYKSSKRTSDCISIKLFSEIQLQQIFDLLFIDETNEDKDSKVFSFDFLNNDKMSRIISKNNVKDTFTAFECTDRLLKNNYIYNEKFFGIIEKIKNLLDNEPNLTQNEKNSCKKYINNIGNPEKSIKAKIISQYNKNKILLDKFISFHKIFIYDFDSSIEKLKKYRDKHTHNDIGILTEELANTTYVIHALIYCMIFKYIGLDDKKIENILISCIC